MGVVTQISIVSTLRPVHRDPPPARGTAQLLPSADGRPAVTTVSSPPAPPPRR